VVSKIQPGDVTTSFLFEGQEGQEIESVSDAVSTEYVLDDFGHTVSVVSPDTGTTHFIFDGANKQISKTDANGIASTYTYDDEYRLTAISYPDASEDVTYTYDQGSHGRGRLTGMSDVSGTYVYCWDEGGNLISEEKTINGIVYNTGYAYDAAGLLTEMTYPDGTVVSYERNAVGNVSRVSVVHDTTTTILADGIEYLPFGPVNAMNLGNGIAVNRSFDLLYRMNGNISYGVEDKSYNLDLLGNVTEVTDNLDSNRNLYFNYDDLYRLADATGTYGNISFDMDDMGNRLLRTVDGVSETYVYATGTSLLDRVAGSSTVDIATDAAGNTTMCGNRSFSYDQANRLTQVQENGVTLGTYITSADGRRMMKTVDGNVTVYHYDFEGRLIANHDPGTGCWISYIYLEGAPLAMVRNGSCMETTCSADLNDNGVVDAADFMIFRSEYGRSCTTDNPCVSDLNSDGAVDAADFMIFRSEYGRSDCKSPAIYYYHSDHLGTPQKMTDERGTVVWAAEYLPFGKANITVETVENILRFPGQYYDAETGLHYNYHRYYDPDLGRYLTPDPIGLDGGSNLFSYAQSNPVNFADYYGLATNPVQAVYAWYLMNAYAINKVVIQISKDNMTGEPGVPDIAKYLFNSIYQDIKNCKGFDPSILYRTEVMTTEFISQLIESYWKFNNPNWRNNPTDPYYDGPEDLKKRYYWESGPNDRPLKIIVFKNTPTFFDDLNINLNPWHKM
jgi:RHS repeat-associated protein